MKSENNKTSWEWKDTYFYCDRNVRGTRPKLKRQRAKQNRRLVKQDIKNKLMD